MTRSLLSSPGGVFIVLGLAILAVRLFDHGLAGLQEQMQTGLLAGTQWRNALFGTRLPLTLFDGLIEVAQFTYLIFMGVMLHQLARISDRLRRLARSMEETS